MVTLESIAASLRIADDWEKKGQPTWVSKCLESALMEYLSMAVIERGDPESGVAWLKSHNVEDVLRREWSVLQALIAEVEGGRLPASVIAGNYQSLVFAHLAWGMEAYDVGEVFVSFSERKDVGELSTTFWREYARGMGALVRQEAYHPIQFKLRGQEKYWFLYLQLIEAASNNESLNRIRGEIDSLLIKRNADKNIRDDSYEIEGSPSQPVRWDFRSFGLLKYISDQLRRK